HHCSSNSPDLNLIEHVWEYIKSKLNLYPETQDVWEHISTDFLQNLYKSMPTRLEEVIKNKGRNT
ncbi:hypothetical protein BGZ80_008961, partial [Entomortierella chlamydospora]